MKEFLSFIFVGSLAATINFFSRIFFSHFFSFTFSIFSAYIVAMIFAYIFSNKIVFKSQPRRQKYRSYIYFVLVNLIAILQIWIFSIFFSGYLLPYLGIHSNVYEISHAISIAIPVFSSYFGHKFFTFKK